MKKLTLEIYTRPSVLYPSPDNRWSIKLCGLPKARSKFLIAFIWPCTKVSARSNHSFLQFLWLIQVINMRRKAVSFQLLKYGSHRSSSLHLAWSVGRGSSAGQAHRQLHISLVSFLKGKLVFKILAIYAKKLTYQYKNKKKMYFCWFYSHSFLN